MLRDVKSEKRIIKFHQSEIDGKGFIAAGDAEKPVRHTRNDVAWKPRKARSVSRSKSRKIHSSKGRKSLVTFTVIN